MKASSSLLPRQRGLSLVELMVALTIGLILSVGLLFMVSNTSRAFKVEDDFARLQENGAIALRFLVDDIRMAGFYGLSMDTTSTALDGASLTAGGITTIGNDCAGSTPSPGALNLAQPIDVRKPADGAAAHTAVSCIQAGDFDSGRGSPVIILRGARGGPVLPADLDANKLYVQSAPTQDPNTILFAGKKFADLKTANLSRSLASGVDAPIFEYQHHVYYIRPCSRPTPPATTCAAGDDGGQWIPTLVRQELVSTSTGPTLQLVPVAEGIEAVNLVFGLDTNNDGVAEAFTNTPPTTPSGWQSVVSIRVSVLAVTTSTTMGYSDAGKKYDIGDGSPRTCALGPDCNLRRHVFSQIASVRNCAERRGGNRSC